MSKERMIAIAKRSNITNLWLKKTAESLSTSEEDLAIAISQNKNVRAETLIVLLKKPWKTSRVIEVIAGVTLDIKVIDKLIDALESNAYALPKDDWYAVKDIIVCNIYNKQSLQLQLMRIEALYYQEEGYVDNEDYFCDDADYYYRYGVT